MHTPPLHAPPQRASGACLPRKALAHSPWISFRSDRVPFASSATFTLSASLSTAAGGGEGVEGASCHRVAGA